MSLEENVKKVREIAKKEADSPSIVHDLDHLRRTSQGAKWLVKVQGGDEKEQLLAEAAGWLHDIKRPLTNEVDHAQASAEKAEEVLKRAGFEKEDIKRVVRAVRHHREKRNWKSPLHSSIYISDKLFEGMGAFIILRRCTWVGESPDFEGEEPLKANIRWYAHRMEKHGKDEIPEKFSELADYQFKWQNDFLQSLKEEKDHALRIMNYCYNTEKTDFERIIRDFEPQSERGRTIKKEAVRYIDGKLFEKFEKIIKD